MKDHFNEMINQIRYQLSVRFLTTQTLHTQATKFKTDLLTSNISKDPRETIQVVVDEIWNTYDVDNDGNMTEEEVRHFIQLYMPEF